MSDTVDYLLICLLGLVVGAIFGFVAGVQWRARRGEPLGAADAPLDKVARKVKRLGPYRVALLVIGSLVVTGSFASNVVIADEWNKAKNAVETAEAVRECQQFNDRESTVAQIASSRAAIEQRDDQAAFLLDQKDFLTSFLVPTLGQEAIIEQRFRDYLASLDESVASLNRANERSTLLIKQLEARDVTCR